MTVDTGEQVNDQNDPAAGSAERAYFPPPVAPAASPPIEPPPTPVYAPPLGRPSSGTGRTVAIVLAIVAGVLLVVVGLGTAIYFLADDALSAVENESSPYEEPELLPLATGNPGPSTATIPLECPQECFTTKALDSVLMGSFTYGALGVPQEGESPAEEWATTTADDEFLGSVGYWKDEAFSPDECFFSAMWAPVSDPVDGRPKSLDDTVRYHADWYSESEYSTLSHTSRLFTSTEAASEHMASLLGQVQQCSGYSTEEEWSVAVTPMPALDLPNSVAAVGWVEADDYGSRTYVADLQRGNLVIRIRLYTDSEITEQKFRDYLWSAAEYLDGSIIR